MLADEFTYTFNDLVLIGRKPENRQHTTWYVACEFCHGRHVFTKQGKKIWHTSCILSGVEWTVTPAEYYIQRPADFTGIMREV